jgi:hypothetical protein
MRIFGDAIDDKIFPKDIKRFTLEEKSLIDKFLNSILREDKKSELEESTIKSFNDRRDSITEIIYKKFYFKNVLFILEFQKFYTNEKETIELLPTEFFHNISTENFLKDLNDDKSITGIFVYGIVYNPKFQSLDFRRDTLRIRTKYEGSQLTTKCKYHINKVSLKMIKNTILKVIKSKKRK